MATKTRPQLPSVIITSVPSGALKRMSLAEREQIEEMVEVLAGAFRIHRDAALDLLLRCAWAKMDRIDVAASLCGKLNGKGGVDAETD